MTPESSSSSLSCFASLPVVLPEYPQLELKSIVGLSLEGASDLVLAQIWKSLLGFTGPFIADTLTTTSMWMSCDELPLFATPSPHVNVLAYVSVTSPPDFFQSCIACFDFLSDEESI